MMTYLNLKYNTGWCVGTMFAYSMINVFSSLFFSTLIMLLAIFLLRHFKREPKYIVSTFLKNECVATGASIWAMEGDTCRERTPKQEVPERIVHCENLSILKKCIREGYTSENKPRSKLGTSKQHESSKKSVTINASVIEHP
ncbi:hypothetical protein M8J77_020751 [Diaphorina citri]|nr:hypothetical protein M8J77_020751 [Diaphorina citri]